MGTTAPTLHLVFTTHWDREWVQTFEQYRFRLVNLFDRLLDILETEPGLTFLFDGQTVVIEDYLAVRPEQRARLQQLAQTGRIVFGPWYVLADQFLEGAEASVRNLQIGSALAREYGGPMLEGYVPDSFGSIATLPAILAGFGIAFANPGRGRTHTQHRQIPLYRWAWRDGSTVLALDRGYGNGLSFAYPNIWENLDDTPPTVEHSLSVLQQIVKRDREQYPVSHLYVSVGLDHMEMRPEMSALIDGANAAQQEFRAISSDIFQYMQAVNAELDERRIELETVVGEMRGDKQYPMHLNGVLSTNHHVKRENRACEVLLADVLEPFSAAYQAKTGQSVAHFLAHGWKELIKNHPHDSICACSKDDVIADILTRNRTVFQLGEILAERLWHELLPSPASNTTTPAVTLFNPTPWRGISPFACCVRVPQRLHEDRYRVLDAGGKCVGTATRLAVKDHDLESYYAVNADLPRLVSKTSPHERADRQCLTALQVEGVADFGDAIGFSTFTLEPGAQDAGTEIKATPISLRNSKVELTVQSNGSVTLVDLATGATFANLGWFEDGADLGDSYCYSALEGDIPITTQQAQAEITLLEQTACRATLQVAVEMAIPAQSNSGKGRCGRWLTHRIVSRYALHAGSDVVHVTTEFENRSLNHRLRMGMTFAEGTHCYSGIQFGVLERPWNTDPDVSYPHQKPMLDYLHFATSSGQGLACLTKGLYECEQDAVGEMPHACITLVRSTTQIGPAAGANYRIEHAKELGQVVAEYAFTPSTSIAETILKAAAYLAPVLGEGHLLSAGDPGLPASLLSIDPPTVAFTCLKRAVDDTGVIVRFFNPGNEAVPVTLRVSLPFAHACRVNLAEEQAQQGDIRTTKGEIILTAQPYEIVTLKLMDAPSDRSLR